MEALQERSAQTAAVVGRWWRLEVANEMPDEVVERPVEANRTSRPEDLIASRGRSDSTT